MSVAVPPDWADRLRTPPVEVLHAWIDADADGTTAGSDEVLTVWTWLASVLPDAVRLDTDGTPVVHIGVIWLNLVPVPQPDLEDAGWPPGSGLVLSGPGISAAELATAEGPGWVVSRSDDPDLPTLVAAAPTVTALHRELAHRVWHRCVDLLAQAGEQPVDPRVAAVAVHDDIRTALTPRLAGGTGLDSGDRRGPARVERRPRRRPHRLVAGRRRAPAALPAGDQRVAAQGAGRRLSHAASRR